ncbi:MAG: ABC transporter permease [Pseudomonadota bacterium]
MKTLTLKLLRDLWRLRSQALAIALVIAAASATLVLSLSVHASLKNTQEMYYTQNRFADVFTDFKRAPRGIIERIESLDGVSVAQGRIKQYVTIDKPDTVEPLRALILSVEDQGTSVLNRLLIKDGRGPDLYAAGEVVVDDSFAKANGFAIGDTLSATIYGTKQDLTIVGRGLAPDYIWAMAPGDLIADDTRFGVLWMGRKALEAVTDRTEAITSISLKLNGQAREQEVVRQLDQILEPYGSAGAYGRDDHISHAFIINELVQLKAMAYSMPPIFLSVACFLVYIVLGRLIRTERSRIGLLKAFGYSSAAITWHYLSFAMVIAFCGVVMGVALGAWLGGEIMQLYMVHYRFPFSYYSVSPGVMGIAAVLSNAAALLGAFGGVRSVALLTPAVAMAPAAPAVYKTGWVERFGIIMNAGGIGNMVTRHLARWPVRSAMTSFGVAMALGLLFSVLQFSDGTSEVIENYYFRSQKQDMSVSLIEPRSPAVIHDFYKLPGVIKVEPRRSVSAKLRNGPRARRTGIEGRPPDGTLAALIDRSGRHQRMPERGLTLSAVLAKKLRVEIGDVVTVEVLEGHHRVVDLPVAMVIKEYVGERAYASLETVAQLTGDGSGATRLQLKIDPARRDDLMRALKSTPAVLGVSERSSERVKFSQMIDENINTFMTFFTVFSAIIVIGVVYNSARIIFSERAHELATLRVLGYTRTEVGSILLGEIAILVFLALPTGCVFGYAFGSLISELVSSDLFRMPFSPARSTYGSAMILVLVASAASAIVVGKRVLELDMVRVLKARD